MSLSNSTNTPNSQSKEGKKDEQIDYTDPKACEDLKQKHDNCFFRWYNEKFMVGTKEEIDCKDEYMIYRECLEVRTRSSCFFHFLTFSK